MAGDTPPPAPPPGNCPGADDYEFDPAEELEPTNELLDVVLTRAGELTLDLIEGVQEHPVLAASLLAAGAGLVVGLIAAPVVPQRRTNAASEAARAARQAAQEAAEAAAGPDLASPFSAAQGRRSRAAASAGQGLRDTRPIRESPLPRMGRRGLDRARETMSDVGDRLGRDGEGSPLPSSVGGSARQAQYAAQLLPLVMALLRNPIVRGWIARALTGRLRAAAHR